MAASSYCGATAPAETSIRRDVGSVLNILVRVILKPNRVRTLLYTASAIIWTTSCAAPNHTREAPASPIIDNI